MEKFLNGRFYSPSQGSLSFEDMMTEILRYIQEKPEEFYDIIVGCDSSSEDSPHFPIAIVVLRKGMGGRFFLKKVRYPASYKKRFSNWHQRILEEVLLSCELALFLREQLTLKVKQEAGVSNYQFRYIHADIGGRGQTRDMVKEVVGLIQGNGFEAKIKPESFAASNVADKYT